MYSSFLVPYLRNFNDWAVYFNGDMICQEDVKDLRDDFDENYAVEVEKYNYKAKISRPGKCNYTRRN